MAEKKTPEMSAVVAGKVAGNNQHLDRVLDSIKKSYSPHRVGQTARQLRIDHTAMFPNEKPVWGYKTTHDKDGNEVKIPRLLFRAGWYLSPEEQYIAEKLLNDPETKQLNETIWAAMEEQGLEVVKFAPEAENAKVIA